ncbi:MAG: glycosyltransferase, partial [Clostridia bacterium]|nr:glycosyltransferase [Clostridia bacterium]
MKKKVLFLIPNLAGGGAEKVLVNLVNNLSQDKFDVTLQTLFDVGVNKQYLLPHVRYIGGWKRQPRGMTQLMKLFSPKFLYKRIIKEKYDIVVSYLEGPTARIVAGCADENTKTVCWIHVEFLGLKNASVGFRSISEAREAYGSFDKIIAVANTVRDDFKRWIPVKNAIDVLYNTNETEQIIQKGQEEVNEVCFLTDKPIVCSVARLRPEKGFDTLLKVHRRLILEGFEHRLYILGEGSEREKLEKMIKEYSLDDSVYLLGFRKNPYAYVAKADLYVCSSLREGF